MAKQRQSGRIFLIPFAIGIGLIIFGFLGNPLDPFDDPIIQVEAINELTGLSIIEVPIDPTTNQILGTVKFGAPIIVPFERSGTILSADGACESLVDINDPRGKREVKFGRLGSGERNAEVSFHGFNGLNCAYGYAEWDLTNLPNDFIATGFTLQLNLKSKQSNQQSCAIGFVDNTLDEITARNLPNRMLWGSDTGGISKLTTSLVPTDTTNTDFLAVGFFVPNRDKYDNDWCETTGVKRWTFAQIEATGFLRLQDGTIREPLVASGSRLNLQAGVDAFNQQLQFNPITQKGNDKFLLVFYGTGTGSGSNIIDHQWWEENGSLLVTGTSKPIACPIGFEQVGFECVPKICDVTFQINQVTNECEPIQCEANENLQVVEDFLACPAVCIDDPFTPTFECGSLCGEFSISRAVCVPIVEQPPMTECESPLILIGETCQDPTFQCDVILNCQEGSIPDFNGCGCVLIECPIGKQLVGSQCQIITCPTNTVLMGSECIEKSCPIGQISIDNQCVSIASCSDCEDDGTILCETGFKSLGDTCVPIDLNCPFGTVEHQNVCVAFLPNLLEISDELPPIALIIAGGAISGLSIVGLIIRRR